MKGVFIPDITVEMLRDASLDTIEDFFSRILSNDNEVTIFNAELPRWISCSERLPEENGNYLVTAMYKGKPDIDMDYWQLGCMWDDWGDAVIAWMPLPEPYEEEKK